MHMVHFLLFFLSFFSISEIQHTMEVGFSFSSISCGIVCFYAGPLLYSCKCSKIQLVLDVEVASFRFYGAAFVSG